MHDQQPPLWHKAVVAWQNHALTELTAIAGYCELLLSEFDGPLTSEQRTDLEDIQTRQKNLLGCWQHLSAYLTFMYGQTDISWQGLALTDLLPEVVRELTRTTPITVVDISMPTTIPLIQGTAWLPRAIHNLVYPQDLSPKLPTMAPSIHVHADDPTTLHVHIGTAVLTNLEPMAQLDPDRLYPGSCLHLAALIVRAHGSAITMTCTSQRTEFDFTLAVWHPPGEGW